jgi:hypothetical protein
MRLSTSPPSWGAQERQNTSLFIRDSLLVAPEPAVLQGQVYTHDPDGTTHALAMSGETRPTAGPAGPDIPASAVRNNRVVIYVDGIRYMRSSQQADIGKLLQSTGDDASLAHVDQPVVGIHEGVGQGLLSDPLRIVSDFVFLKAIQGGNSTAGQIAAIYANDPAVKSLHDEVRQSLEAGRDVLLAAHSGGGTETALALTLLSQEEDGRFAAAVGDHVRVLQIAPAASLQDFQWAGVRPENIYYTDSRSDPAYGAFHVFVPPDDAAQMVTNALSALVDVKPSALERHSPYYIFAHNRADGESSIQQFIDGAPNGGDHSFTD